MDNPFAILSQRLENIESFMASMSDLLNNHPSKLVNAEAAADEPLISDVDLAGLLGCKKSTILKYARNGVIPFYKVGRKYSFKKSEVDTALSSLTPIKRNKKGVKANG